MIKFPNIDPIIFTLGPLNIRWYSLAYICGIILGYLYLKWIDKKYKIFSFTNIQIDSLFTHIVIGIIVGGRLGYVLFYEPLMFVNNPINVINTLQGGMSFHGGLIGYCIAAYIFCKKNQIPYLKLLDISSCIASIGIFFGRIANFINAELYGKVTTLPLGVIFPTAGPYARHPSQIYEAFTEGILLFLLQNFFLYKRKYKQIGFLSASFLLFYGSTRLIIEFFREADIHIGYFFNLFTIGQFYCLVMIGLGIYLLNLSKKN